MALKDRCLMTWEGSKSRWRKMYRGKMYFISCYALGCPPTKEASYQKANEWWRQKLVEVDSSKPVLPSYGGILDKLEFRRDWCRKHDRHNEAALWDLRIKDLLKHPDTQDFDPNPFLYTPDLPERIEAFQAYGGTIPDYEDPLAIEFTLGDGRRWYDREMEEFVKRAPEDKTIGGLSSRYLENFEARYHAGDLSPGECDLTRRCVGHFVDWIGATNGPDIINPERWESYWRHLLKRVASGEISVVYAKKDWSYARRFVQWLASMAIIPLPANINNRAYRFGDTARAIPTFSVEEVKTLVREAPGQLKLHLLLMLNCGFNQSDIAALLKSEVELEAGTVTRKRTKTRKHHGKAVPTVTWKLWPVTLALLQGHWSDHPTLALTTLKGKPWTEEAIVGGKAKSRDGIASNFKHLQRRLGITKPLKVLRKTSATLLGDHAEFAIYAQHFLGHAPDGMTARHYQAPSQARFDAAIAWLGMQYGFVE